MGRRAQGVGLPRARLAIEDRGECEPMARAIATADIVSTVSQRYAEEILTPEFGERLQDLLRSRGAASSASSTASTRRPSILRPTRHRRALLGGRRIGKATDKEALQRESGSSMSTPKAPVFGVVGRLVEQKGIDLLTAVAPGILERRPDRRARLRRAGVRIKVARPRGPLRRHSSGSRSDSTRRSRSASTPAATCS